MHGSNEARKMKTALKVPKATVHVKSVQKVSSGQATGNQAGEALSLSPERVENGVSTETELLKRILAQTSTDAHFRHSGINE